MEGLHLMNSSEQTPISSHSVCGKPLQSSCPEQSGETSEVAGVSLTLTNAPCGFWGTVSGGNTHSPTIVRQNSPSPEQSSLVTQNWGSAPAKRTKVKASAPSPSMS